MKITAPLLLAAALAVALPSAADNTDLRSSLNADYHTSLRDLFVHFHRNPELSFLEHATAARLALELREAGFTVTEGVGGTGLVALLENGDGPLVMLRADMDGLPVEERSGLDYASTATQIDPISGREVAVMHACGHDVHMVSLVATARQMAARRDSWSGTLMLIGQPAEERISGARIMREEQLWERFGTPDYALAFHVAAGLPAGVINVQEGSPMAGSDSVDIVIHGVGSHGAAPHMGKDPVVLGSQIVLALQTLVARELPPRQPGVVTVGSFHAGSKHNIIPDRAELQLTVRNTNLETRQLLLEGIERIATNLGRAAGLPEDKLPEVSLNNPGTPPTVNDDQLVKRLRGIWQQQFGRDQVVAITSTTMGAEDFPYFTNDPSIPSVYFAVGGTSQSDLDAAASGGAPIPSHHSPLFKVEPELSITRGAEASVAALLELMPN